MTRALPILAGLLCCGSACSDEPPAHASAPPGVTAGTNAGSGGMSIAANDAGGSGSSAGSSGVSAPIGQAGSAGAARDAGQVSHDSGAGGAAGVSAPSDSGEPMSELDAGGEQSESATRPIADPPVYLGSGNGGCTAMRETMGFEPDEAGASKHPLFLYFVGTRFVDSDTSARFDSEAAKKITEAMARRGFVALSADYDNSLSLAADKVSCTFASSNAMSLLQLACARANVDCALGIATWGHSQGALMAHAASVYDTRIRAVWTTGYSGGDYPLPDSRLRVVNGEGDAMNGNWATLNKASGMSDTECPDDGRSSCLRADGSGWILVTRSDCVTSSADHCWFDRTSCTASAITLEPNWIDPQSNKPFALEANADWVAETTRRP